MNDILNPAQSISYTNKDFQTLFPELLELAKKLTSRWDPSISNESDPGVVLLKLNAIIADKLNYNIDKNVLECFPLSVTQEENARRLFEQLGYRMHWYKSAYTNISLKWAGEVSNTGYVTIPPFTMVSDADNTVIYSLIGSPDGIADESFSVEDSKLFYNGDILTLKAIQGLAIKYDINGNTTIKVNQLDSNNRLYFNSNDVAQNGIFITNVGTNNYSSWIQKDNLVTENLNNTYYSFGISEDGSACYLEFPDDAENIIKDGIEITYIKSRGTDGNISANVIDKFYNDVYLTDSTGSTVVLNEDNIRLFNYASVTNGKDPETINSAYANYKKVIGTFDVLVTIRDYVNYILRSGLVSNCFVCDRTNDIQCTYSVMAYDNEIDTIHRYQETQPVLKTVRTTQGVHVTGYLDEETLSAFDIKLYLLSNVSSFGSYADYLESFRMLSNDAQQPIKYYIEDSKCISHDYADILPITNESAHVCFFKNKFPITARIVTKYPLTTSQASEVKEHILSAFYQNLNSKVIEFSEGISLDIINNLILGADERIKTAIIDNIEYITYAVYWDGTTFQEVDITSENVKPITVDINYVADTYDPTAGYNVGDFCVYNGSRYKCRIALDAPAGRWSPSKWEVNDIAILSVEEQTYITKVGFNNYNTYSFVWDSTLEAFTLEGDEADITEYGITVDESTLQDGDILNTRVSVASQIRDEVYAKSILAGVTPLYTKDEDFDYSFNQVYNNQLDEIYKIYSNVNIHFSNESPTYKLKANEYLQFYAPNFINGTSYSNYVKFEYNIASDIEANADYQLRQNEYIIFYWKTDEDVIDVYNYYVYGEGNIIHPTFVMNHQEGMCIGASLASASNLHNVGTTENPIYVADTAYNGPMSQTISDSISNIISKSNILSGMKTITIRKVNRIELDPSYYCYWVLNDEDNGRYVLFEEDEEVTSQTYILNTGEYFFYTNSSLTELGVLGSGTTIQRNSGEGNWIVPATVSLEDILENGTNAIKDVWQHPLTGQTTTITENQYVTIGPDSYVQLTRNDGFDSWDITFSSEVTEGGLSSYTIKYMPPGAADWITVSNISINGADTGWRARTLLSVNLGPYVSQRLLDNQSITVEFGDGSTETINGQGVSTISVPTGSQSYPAMTIPYYPVVLESSENITFDGGGSQTVADTYYNGELNYNSIYYYSEMVTSLDKVYRVTTDGDIILTFKPGVNTLTIPYRMPVGNYLFRLKNSSLEIGTLTVENDGVLLGAIYDSTFTNFANISSVILKLPVETLEETTTDIVINVSNHTSDVTITLSNPFKYTKPEEISQFEFEKYDNKIIYLDQQHIYNYMYQPDENTRILNPLLAKSFLESNHIFNDFVICELYFKSLDNDIQVLNILK